MSNSKRLFFLEWEKRGRDESDDDISLKLETMNLVIDWKLLLSIICIAVKLLIVQIPIKMTTSIRLLKYRSKQRNSDIEVHQQMFK